MSLSIYDVSEDYLIRNKYKFKMALKERTYFGNRGDTEIKQEHEVLDRKEFSATDLLRKLHGKAVRQLGTSGSGNHFVEFGRVEITDNDIPDVEPGNYLGLLVHSGSRGLGAAIASKYTQIAREKCLLPKHAANLAWLDLNSEEGQEYWMSMNLAGDYARACHDQIHRNVSEYLGLRAIGKVENHHNFAWKEKQENGEDWIVHRKGATPAAKGQLGIIPASMTSVGYIVNGKGGVNTINSASHGAGRKMSRGKAKSSVTGSQLKKMLRQANVDLIGGGVDEAPVVYKDLEEVMRAQSGLVNIVGKFIPKIVRMDKA